MMMAMLEAGGLPVLSDGVRTADDDNPRGYYEFERVKQLPQRDVGWLPDARGRAVKVISGLLEHLPDGERYRIVFMRRHLGEVLSSQREMLARRGEATDATSDAKMAEFFSNHLARVESWLAARPNMDVLYVSYNELLDDPRRHAERVAVFLNCGLDVAAMTQAVSASLYRQRR